MKMPRESYTIPERPADPPAMRPVTLPSMPPGYQGTKPFLSEEEREVAVVHSPPPSWWRENNAAIRAALPLPEPRYVNRAEGEPWIVFFGIITVVVLISIAITAAVTR